MWAIHVFAFLPGYIMTTSEIVYPLSNQRKSKIAATFWLMSNLGECWAYGFKLSQTSCVRIETK